MSIQDKVVNTLITFVIVIGFILAMAFGAMGVFLIMLGLFGGLLYVIWSS